MSLETETKIFRRPEDFIGTWTLRSGEVLVISKSDLETDNPFDYWDSNGDAINPRSPKDDLMSKKRGAELQ